MKVDNIIDGGKYMLYEIEDVVISDILDNSVFVQVSVYPEYHVRDVDTIISQNYSQLYGRATIYDIRTILADWMKQKGAILANVNISNDDFSVSFSVLYSDINRGRHFEDYLNKYFLLSAYSHLSLMSQHESVFFLTEDGSFSAQLIVTFDKGTEGSTTSFTKDISIEPNTHGLQTGRYNINFADLLEEAKTIKEDAVLKSVVLKSGSRYAQFFFERGAAHRVPFVFFNEFNALELVNIDGVTTEVTDAARQVAECGHKHVQYDLVVNKSFKFESSALLFQQKVLIEELFASHVAYSVVADKLMPIVLTESKAEFDNQYANVPYAKFEFVLENDTPIKADVRLLDGIFNDVYNYVYA